MFHFASVYRLFWNFLFTKEVVVHYFDEHMRISWGKISITNNIFSDLLCSWRPTHHQKPTLSLSFPQATLFSQKPLQLWKAGVFQDWRIFVKPTNCTEIKAFLCYKNSFITFWLKSIQSCKHLGFCFVPDYKKKQCFFIK